VISVRPIERGDRPWVAGLLEGAFGGVTVARKGALIDAFVLPGFVATDGGRPVGLLTYDAVRGECEIVAIISAEKGRGIGRALMDAARDHAAAAGCHRLWLITTNDNVDALRFYQRRGFRLAALYPGAVDHSRVRSKPEIPEVGEYGIPLHDEIELEKRL
jgi:ribosomal protein S18 acetylase RimI-like enzyme